MGCSLSSPSKQKGLEVIINDWEESHWFPKTTPKVKTIYVKPVRTHRK